MTQTQLLRGHKRYELSNHLGNVLATVSDKRVVTSSASLADIHSLQDYYPFGMTMKGRSASLQINGGTTELAFQIDVDASPGNYQGVDTYRFGFNGMEKDDELKGAGNSYDFGARLYDPRLGRWLTVDPMTESQPEWSPYKAFLCNPLVFVDPNGKTEYRTTLYVNVSTGEAEKIVYQEHNSIMTDGVQHDANSTFFSKENRYYDFRTTRVVHYEEVEINGKKGMSVISSETLETELLRSDGIKDSDYVWDDGARNGDTKAESIFRTDTKVGRFVGHSDKRPGLIVWGDNLSSDRSPGTSSDGKVWGTINFSEFQKSMAVLSTALRNSPGAITKKGGVYYSEKGQGRAAWERSKAPTKLPSLINKGIKTIKSIQDKQFECKSCGDVFYGQDTLKHNATLKHRGAKVLENQYDEVDIVGQEKSEESTD